MMRTTRRRNWFIKRIALGFAVAAIAAPVAHARVDEGIPGQPNAPKIVKAPHSVMPPAPRDSRTLIPCVPACGHEELISQSLVDEYADHFVRGAETSAVSTPQVVSSSGFDWGDAGIGAGLALVLLAGGAALATRHLGREQTA
jgi:hypothetical protein